MPPARPPRACLALRRSARASAHAKQPPVGGGCWGKGGGALPHPHPAPGVHAAGAVSTRAVCTVTAASQTNRPLPPPLLVVHLPASLAPSSPPRSPSPAVDESALSTVVMRHTVLLCVRYTTLIDSRYLVPIWRASQWDHRCDERVHCSRSAPPPRHLHCSYRMAMLVIRRRHCASGVHHVQAVQENVHVPVGSKSLCRPPAVSLDWASRTHSCMDTGTARVAVAVSVLLCVFCVYCLPGVCFGALYVPRCALLLRPPALVAPVRIVLGLTTMVCLTGMAGIRDSPPRRVP